VDNLGVRKYVSNITSYTVRDYIETHVREVSAKVDTVGRSPDPRRAGARVLDTAEGVLIALRGCSLNKAFVEIAQTAKAHDVSTLSLADALVALAQNQASLDGDDAALVAARAAWGHLLDRVRPGRGAR
jgi:hypothetical protein